MGGLRSCMGLTGCATIDELRTKAEFVRISSAGIEESPRSRRDHHQKESPRTPSGL